MKRLEANRKILKLLSAAVEQHPNWRFHQILQETHIILFDSKELQCLDQYFEESADTLERMTEHLED